MERNDILAIFAGAALLAAFLALGLGYQQTVPLFETPDEPSHIEYLAFVHAERRLPRYAGKVEVPGEGVQAPLYYILLAPLYAAVAPDPALREELHRVNLAVYERDATLLGQNRLVLVRPRTRGAVNVPHFAPHPHLAKLRLLRLPSLLFGALAVLLTFAAARRATGSVPTAALAAGLLALNPQFLFLSSGVNPDPPATALGAAALLLLARALGTEAGPGRRDYLALGVLVGVGLLLKKTSLPVLAASAAALALADPRGRGTRARDAALAALLALLMAAPFLAWNARYHGGPLGGPAFARYVEPMPGYEEFGGAWSYFTGTYPVWTFCSFWARFGWMHVHPPGWVLATYLLLSVAGLAGFALAWRDAGREGWRALRCALPAACVLTVLGHAWVNLSLAQAQGRHLLPTAPFFCLLLALGLRRLAAEARIDCDGRAAAAGLAGLALLAIYCLAGVIMPAYAG